MKLIDEITLSKEERTENVLEQIDSMEFRAPELDLLKYKKFRKDRLFIEESSFEL